MTRPQAPAPAVSVIVPTFNARATLAETLDSALGQTHADLEVVVVDDGSTDGTGEIAAAFAARDSRVRLITQANQGVAAARNAAIDAARGRFIAPLDHDDLWHPQKLAWQLRAFDRAGGRVGLVYNWFREINAAGRVIGGEATPVVEGWVPHRHLVWNFISNGSTPLIRRELFNQARYATVLAEAGVAGCEDYYLQLDIAHLAPIACAPAFLTGYRKTAQADSRNVARMIRAHILMFERIAAVSGPPARRLCQGEIARRWVDYGRNRARRGLIGEALAALVRAARTAPSPAAARLADQAWQTGLYLGRHLAGAHLDKHQRPGARPFADYDPLEHSGRWRPDLWGPRLRRLTALDQAYGRSMEAQAGR